MSASAPIVRERLKSTLEAGSVRVNIGSGIDAPEAWYNIDNSPTVVISRVPILQKLLGTPAWPTNVRRHNVLKGLPLSDETVEVIYSSHTFDHFTYPQSVAVTRECFRVLKPQGILRIAVPDLEKMVRDYLSDPAPLASHRFIDRLLLRQSWRDILHPGAHHSQMLDCRSLLTMFAEAGFDEARLRGFRESAIPDILEIELESRRSESLYVEAVKRPMVTQLSSTH